MIRTMAAGLVGLCMLCSAGQANAALLGSFGYTLWGNHFGRYDSMNFEMRFANQIQMEYRNFTEESAPLFFDRDIYSDGVFVLDSGPNFLLVANEFTNGIDSPISVKVARRGFSMVTAPESYWLFGDITGANGIDLFGASIDRIVLTISDFAFEDRGMDSSGINVLTAYTLTWQIDVFGTAPAAVSEPPALAVLATALTGLGYMAWRRRKAGLPAARP